MSPSFVNVLVSWSANASSFCSVVVFCYVVVFVNQCRVYESFPRVNDAS